MMGTQEKRPTCTSGQFLFPRVPLVRSLVGSMSPLEWMGSVDCRWAHESRGWPKTGDARDRRCLPTTMSSLNILGVLYLVPFVSMTLHLNMEHCCEHICTATTLGR